MNIDEAATGEEAQQKIEQLPPNLILMDVKLPDESGFKLTRKIKTDYPEIPIIILTSYNIPEYRDAAHESGADYFLVKNLSTRKEIIEAVECSLPDLALNHKKKN